MASGIYKCIQIVFIICNFIGILMGIAMVAVGAYLFVTKGNFLNLMPKYEDVNITAVMIAAGIIVFVVAFIGFCGAWMESQCLLIIYFTMVFVIFALEIAVGIVGLIYKDDIDEEVKTQLLDGLKTSKRWPTWDAIQSEFKCCGVEKKDDWYAIMSNTVPDSCCSYEDCGKRPELAYDKGCYEKVKSELKNNFIALGIAGIVLGILQIINLVISMVLICAIRRSRNVAV
ncbi:tetraspanin-9-like [Pomacea canaliculata]|uniref:tetraspanin-9-like n=1 Tax=Pomacea canaliculata TaxID=400727 RepID=UPI000D73C80E|nr:tetraspanin-9-like [Pomacea canaliculata]XP_025087800.1 tetraspanin-9-like [Pomacea canaliculata]